MQNNNINAATFVLQSLRREHEIRKPGISVTHRRIVAHGEVHQDGKGWLPFKVLLPITGSPLDFKLKFIGRPAQYRARYYGIREAMMQEIESIITRFKEAADE